MDRTEYSHPPSFQWGPLGVGLNNSMIPIFSREYAKIPNSLRTFEIWEKCYDLSFYARKTDRFCKKMNEISFYEVGKGKIAHVR